MSSLSLSFSDRFLVSELLLVFQPLTCAKALKVFNTVLQDALFSESPNLSFSLMMRSADWNIFPIILLLKASFNLGPPRKLSTLQHFSFSFPCPLAFSAELVIHLHMNVQYCPIVFIFLLSSSQEKGKIINPLLERKRKRREERTFYI